MRDYVLAKRDFSARMRMLRLRYRIIHLILHVLHLFSSYAAYIMCTDLLTLKYVGSSNFFFMRLKVEFRKIEV